MLSAPGSNWQASRYDAPRLQPMNLINNIIDVLFIVLCVTCFGTIIWYNITEVSKARRNLRKQERQ